MPQFERALAIDPKMPEAHYYLGESLVMKGQQAEGLSHWRQALKLDPGNLELLNDTAWLLATSADAALRNGAEAVPLAERAVQISQAHEPTLMGTLAAAYAEAGNYEKAIETEQHAADLATQQGKQELAATLRGRLAILQARTPIRQQPKAN
jgi:tetratricopeptide (TPR) repeat protein